MNDRERHDDERRELAVARYVWALDEGDLDALTVVLQEAEIDALLDDQLAGVTEALHAEAGLPPAVDQARLVRRLLRQHLPSAFPSDEEPTAPTVGDAARQLQADLAAGPTLAPADAQAHARLLASDAPLPVPVTATAVQRIAGALGVAASPRYWERFRRAAVVVAVSQQRGMVQLAAAR